jgi:hypothetical protein
MRGPMAISIVGGRNFPGKSPRLPNVPPSICVSGRSPLRQLGRRAGGVRGIRGWAQGQLWGDSGLHLTYVTHTGTPRFLTVWERSHDRDFAGRVAVGDRSHCIRGRGGGMSVHSGSKGSTILPALKLSINLRPTLLLSSSAKRRAR